MHYSIYQHLKTCLQAATEKAYPEKYPHLKTIPITFSSITPNPLTDIATPYPLKISQFTGLPVVMVSQHLLEHFQIKTDYLSNTIDNIPYRGFFNFRLSNSFLLRSVYETGFGIITDNNILTTNKPDIICKIILLLQKNGLEHLPSLSQFIEIPLPDSTAEQNAARLIALSDPDGIHSVKTCKYFKRRLLYEADNCYRKCPLQTDDGQLSALRFLTFKALSIRIIQLSSIKQK